MGWLSTLLPTEDRFFDLFGRHAAPLVEGAQALPNLLRCERETLAFCARIDQLENDADNITREVLIAVRCAFITPFDRTDIAALISSPNLTLGERTRRRRD